MLKPSTNIEGRGLNKREKCIDELEIISRTFVDGREKAKVNLYKDNESAYKNLSEMKQQIQDLEIKDGHLRNIKQELLDEIEKELLAVLRIVYLERQANWGTTPEITRNMDAAAETVTETMTKEIKLIEDGVDYCKNL